MQVDPGLSFEGDGRATKKFANGCGQIGEGRRTIIDSIPLDPTPCSAVEGLEFRV